MLDAKIVVYQTRDDIRALYRDHQSGIETRTQAERGSILKLVPHVPGRKPNFAKQFEFDNVTALPQLQPRVGFASQFIRYHFPRTARRRKRALEL